MRFIFKNPLQKFTSICIGNGPVKLGKMPPGCREANYTVLRRRL